MNRAFDPFLLDRIDECSLDDDLSDITYVERCTICGADNLVREADNQLVDLDGVAHKCSEVV